MTNRRDSSERTSADGRIAEEVVVATRLEESKPSNDGWVVCRESSCKKKERVVVFKRSIRAQ